MEVPEQGTRIQARWQCQAKFHPAKHVKDMNGTQESSRLGDKETRLSETHTSQSWAAGFSRKT